VAAPALPFAWALLMAWVSAGPCPAQSAWATDAPKGTALAGGAAGGQAIPANGQTRQALPIPPQLQVPPGPDAVPATANPGDSGEVAESRPRSDAPPAADTDSPFGALRSFNVEPGGHILEFRGSGVYGPYHDESERWLDFSLIVQAEYLQNSPNNGPNTEQLFFRRLRPVIMGGMDDWQGIIMLDFGAGEDGTTYSTAIRWANFQYVGFDQAHATFGSFKPWFSRELLTDGPHLEAIERSPVGDTNYGNPDYMIGFAWDQMLENRQVAYYVSVGLEDHLQSVSQMQMRSPAYAASGANQGVLATGRLDFYPLGEMPYDPRPLHTPPPPVYFQADFHTDTWRMIVSTAAYGWINDNNSNPFTVNGASTSTTMADLDRAFGIEVSGGLRGFGVSADLEYQFIHGDLLVSTFTGGLFVNGRTDLNKLSVNAGYMLPYDVELVGTWSAVRATGFERPLTEVRIGMNWFLKKYAIRFSGEYTWVDNMNGTPGYNVGVTRALAQFVW
jgi:hypothetical protein